MWVECAACGKTYENNLVHECVDQSAVEVSRPRCQEVEREQEQAPINRKLVNGYHAYHSDEFRAFALRWLGFDPRTVNARDVTIIFRPIDELVCTVNSIGNAPTWKEHGFSGSACVGGGGSGNAS